MLARIRKAMEEREEGFTLIELLVVIIIIGILAAIAIPVFLNQRKKGYDAQAKSDLRNLATLQGRFHCPACDLPSEWPVHRCGTRTLHRGGSRWLDNDGVNFAATLTAAVLAWAAWAWRCPCS